MLDGAEPLRSHVLFCRGLLGMAPLRAAPFEAVAAKLEARSRTSQQHPLPLPPRADAQGFWQRRFTLASHKCCPRRSVSDVS